MEISRLESAYDYLKSDPSRICDFLLGDPSELDRYGKLFRKVWKLAGKPDYLDFGKHAFFNHCGHVTTNTIRTESIFHYLKKLNKPRCTPSSYIFKKDMTRYDEAPDGQDKYVFEVQRFIKKLVELIAMRPPSSICGNEVFFDIVLSFCARKRKELAFNAGSMDSELFGALQSSQPANPGLITPISGYSLEYNDRMQKTLTDLCLGGQSPSLEFKGNFTGEALQREFTRITSEKVSGISFEHLISIVKEPSDLHTIRLVGMVKRFLDKSAERSEYLSRTYMSATRMITLRKRSYSLSVYVTETASPATVYLLHTSPFLHKKLLKEASFLFMDALKFPRISEDNLLMKVAKFQYLLSHITPFWRGSAAICEWIEMAIFCYHGYNVSYPEKTCMNLEALTLSLEEFIKKYPSLINIYFND